MKASKEKENRERELATARQQKENEERIKAAKVKRYEDAAELAIVLDNGNLTRKRIFIELRGSVAQGQRYEVRAEQSGTFSYKTVLGARRRLSDGF